MLIECVECLPNTKILCSPFHSVNFQIYKRYQLMAFESNTKNTWKQYMHYYYGILKAILCALTQSLGMCIIMVDYVETGMDCREADSYQDWEAICPGGLTELFTTGESPWVIFGSLQYKILAFLFSAFLGMCSVL